MSKLEYMMKINESTDGWWSAPKSTPGLLPPAPLHNYTLQCLLIATNYEILNIQHLTIFYFLQNIS